MHRKYLGFIWNEVLYEFTCLSNGSSSAPRVFTKLMKPAFATLRSAGYLSLPYYDALLMAENRHDWLTNINEVIKVSNLGFTINYYKSILMPTHSIKFLGFISSTSMNTEQTTEKIYKVIFFANSIISNKTCAVYSLRHLRGSVHDFSFSDYLSPFYFLLI